MSAATSEVDRMTQVITFVPPATGDQPFPFLKLIPEVRNKIYEYALYLPRPVYLTRRDTLYANLSYEHRVKCSFPDHSELWIARPGMEKSSSLTAGDIYTWCVNPFNKERKKLLLPRSILELRLVNRQIDNEMKYIFYRINNFHFRTALDAYDAMCKNPFQYLWSAIEEMSFNFSSNDAKACYSKIRQVCPNLKVLRVTMCCRDKRNIVLNRYQDLMTARGMEHFSQSFKNLEALELAGCDYIEGLDSDGNLSRQVADVNHPDAVGPWLKARMVKQAKPKQRIVGASDQQDGAENGKTAGKATAKSKAGGRKTTGRNGITKKKATRKGGNKKRTNAN